MEKLITITLVLVMLTVGMVSANAMSNNTAANIELILNK
jgi:hypothetical protein